MLTPAGMSLWGCVSPHRRRTSWRCFLAAVCATFTLSQLSRNAQHGMIGFTGIHTYENKDWLMQLPFILVNAGTQWTAHGSAHPTWQCHQRTQHTTNTAVEPRQ